MSVSLHSPSPEASASRLRRTALRPEPGGERFATSEARSIASGTSDAPISARLRLLDLTARTRAEADAMMADSPSEQEAFTERFTALAEDADAFHALITEVYGPNHDAVAAEGLRQRTLAGDLSWMPRVEYVPRADLAGAHGAYDAASDTVYLAEDIAGTALAAEVLAEEVGHALDVRLVGEDTRGDEGELFRRLLGGEALTAIERAAIRAENDGGTITIDGETRTVEFWNPIRWVRDEIIEPAVEFVDEHIVEPVVEFGRDVVDIGQNAVETAWDIGKTIVTGGWELGGQVLSGDFSGAWDTIRDTGREVFSEAGGFVVETVAMGLHAAVGLFNGVTGVAEYRGLTTAERSYLEAIYGDSLDYDAIRIQRGGVESWVGMDPHVVGNDIYLPDSAFGANDEVTNLPLLAHEAGHVWQFQNAGAGYISDALISYVDDRDEAYNWEGALTELRSFDDMTPDQQVEFARLIGQAMADERAASGSNTLTRRALESVLGRSLTNAEFSYFQDIQARLLAGDA